MFFGIISCDTKEKTPKEQKSESVITTKDKEAKPQLAWKIEKLKEDEYGSPVSRITLLINGKEEALGEIKIPLAEIPPTAFSEKGIPADAVIACGGHWGGETNYYAVMKGEEVIVMVGGPNENEETAQQKPFIYEVFKTIKLR